MQRSEDDLFAVRSFGKTSLREVKEDLEFAWGGVFRFGLLALARRQLIQHARNRVD